MANNYPGALTGAQIDALPGRIDEIEEGMLPIDDTDAGSDIDFAISDQAGNILVEFKRGEIKTKNFDSEKIRHLRIFSIGNSYALDSFSYVPFILKRYGITVEIGIYYRAGGSIQDAVEEFYSINGKPTYYIDTRVHTQWQEAGNKNIATGLTYKVWDIVVIQQGSVPSVEPQSFEPYTSTLIGMILDTIQRPIKLAWNININRKSSGTGTSVEETILSNIKNTLEKEPISLIFPYGTAVFDARTNETLDAIGDGGHLWSSDEIHLQEGLPCYIAALANVQALFNMYYPEFSVVGDTTRPTDAVRASWNIPGQNGSSVGVNEENCRLAQVCAVLANNNKFVISQID